MASASHYEPGVDFPGLPFTILEVGIELVADGLIAGGEPDRRTLSLDS